MGRESKCVAGLILLTFKKVSKHLITYCVTKINMEENISLLKKKARRAGLLYLGLLPAAYGLMYVPSQIIVKGNDAATINNLVNKEFLFRSGIVCTLFTAVIFIYLAMALYRLFKGINEYLPKLLVAFVIMQIPITFLLEISNITALMTAKGAALKSLDTVTRTDFTMLFLKIHTYGISIQEIFWGLWLFPFGLLVYKSNFIPRAFGVFLIINGAAYIFISLTFLLFPDYRSSAQLYTFPLLFGELAIILWLLIKGVRNNYGLQLIK